MDAPTTLPDILALINGAGTPVAGIIVFLLYRLNKEVGDLKTELKTFTDVMSRFVPGARIQ